MKMLRLLGFVSMTALVMPVGAVAQTKDKNAEKKVCRAGGVPTGSIFAAKRECHTKAEWVEIDKANEANKERFSADRDRSRSMNTPN